MKLFEFEVSDQDLGFNKVEAARLKTRLANGVYQRRLRQPEIDQESSRRWLMPVNKSRAKSKFFELSSSENRVEPGRAEHDLAGNKHRRPTAMDDGREDSPFFLISFLSPSYYKFICLMHL